jgi:hypothetical protein
MFNWYRTNFGKSMPVEPEPHPEGNVKIDVVSNIATVVAPGSSAPLYMSHFVTCPGAAAHRRR